MFQLSINSKTASVLYLFAYPKRVFRDLGPWIKLAASKIRSIVKLTAVLRNRNEQASVT